MKHDHAGASTIDVSFSPVAESIETHGCSAVVRRIVGPEATELFLHCAPVAAGVTVSEQAEAAYRAICDALAARGGSFRSVVSETVFLRDLRVCIEPIREARRRVLAEHGAATHGPATTEIEQPPLNGHAFLEVSVHAVLPTAPQSRPETIEVPHTCGCDECARSHGLRIQLGDEIRFHAAGLCGTGEGAYEQTLGMYARAEALLHRAGLELSHVARTWIHLREMGRDYADFNRARREFFSRRGIDPAPASTAIGGTPVSAAHDLCLAVYAVKSAGPPLRTVMTSPTLNEAAQYGADFVRGMKQVERNRIALHVSGTASIDERGRTAHPGDFEAQTDRMLVNIAALLERQRAGFGDVVAAVTYLKRSGDGLRLRAKLRQAGFEGFPHALVVAPICRDDLLCETEALAVLPAAVAEYGPQHGAVIS
jgi:enamine deaminase RidA (YjgF/YER057c/UK114 family)